MSTINGKSVYSFSAGVYSALVDGIVKRKGDEARRKTPEVLAVGKFPRPIHVYRCVLSKQAKSVALVDELVEKLEAAIFRGEFPPGTRIREARLANALGVGRGPLREAVRRLEGRKLVVRHPNLGTSVAALTKAELAELLEVREALEVAACRLAAQNITDEGLEKLRLTLLRHQDVKPDKLSDLYSEWHNLDFHYQIALASGNRRLIDLLCGDIWCLLRLYRYPGVLSPGRIPLGYADHQSILEALEAHDPDACEKVMRQHLAHSREVLLHGMTGNELVQTKAKRGIGH